MIWKINDKLFLEIKRKEPPSGNLEINPTLGELRYTVHGDENSYLYQKRTIKINTDIILNTVIIYVFSGSLTHGMLACSADQLLFIAEPLLHLVIVWKGLMVMSIMVEILSPGCVRE